MSDTWQMIIQVLLLVLQHLGELIKGMFPEAAPKPAPGKA